MGKFIGKDKPEEILRLVAQLEFAEFLGICTILGIELVEGEKERPFEKIWEDVCDKIGELDRKKRRNLGRLVRAAANGGHEGRS